MAEQVRRMLRWTVPVDSAPHAFVLTSDPVHVAVTALPHIVEFWAEDVDDDESPHTRRVFQVYGTGHDLPAGARWVGTCDRTPDGLVWHLYELTKGAAGG